MTTDVSRFGSAGIDEKYKNPAQSIVGSIPVFLGLRIQQTVQICKKQEPIIPESEQLWNSDFGLLCGRNFLQRH
jgi:hypothetical protein